MNTRTENLTPFKPGQSGNPGGRPKDTADFKRLRKLGRDQFKEIAECIILGRSDQLRDYKMGLNATPLQQWIASIALKGIQHGDMGALNMLLNRIIGPVREELDTPKFKPTVIFTHSGDRVELGMRRVDDPCEEQPEVKDPPVDAGTI